MTRLLSAELFKLRTTRTFYGIVGIGVGLVLIIAVLASALGKHTADDEVMRNLMGLANLAQAFAMVLGVLAITTEFRHGTITPTLLTVPGRTRLLMAKLAASVLTGLLIGLLATGLVALIVSVISNARGYDDGSSGSEVAKMVIGGTLASGLFGAFGLGLGALVRNQVGAIIGGLVYLVVLEPLTTLMPTVGDWIQKYGLGGAATALSATGSADQDVLRQLPGGLLLLGYAAVFVIAGTVMVNKRDVSA
jgi:ABC-2 type transport system permease protein